MKTSVQWWNEVKQDEAKMVDWLKDQYHGELTAVEKINNYLVPNTKEGTIERKILEFIMEQESTHAEWVKGLLESRNIPAERLNKQERYWEQTLPSIDSLEYGSAVAAHAEEMRLERITAICNDSDTPVDIKKVFSKILTDEIGHAQLFTKLAGDKKGLAAENHARGLEAIGLII